MKRQPVAEKSKKLVVLRVRGVSVRTAVRAGGKHISNVKYEDIKATVGS